MATSKSVFALILIAIFVVPAVPPAQARELEAPTSAITATSLKRPNLELSRALAAAAMPGARRTPILSGTLLDEAGEPIRDTPLRLDLEPSREVTAATAAGVGIEVIKLDETTTDGSGAFTFDTPALTSLDGYVDASGRVSVLVTSAGGQHAVMRRTYVYPPSRKAARWLSAGPAGAESPGRRLAASSGAPRLQLTGHRSTTSIPNPGKYCPDGYGGYSWRKSSLPVIKRMVPLQTVHTRSKTTAQYQWSSTAKTSVEAVAVVSGQGSEFKTGYTRAQTFSSGVTFKIGANQNVRLLAEFEFRTWDLVCVDNVTLKTKLVGVFEWRPDRFTGGNSKQSLKRTWPCKSDNTIQIGSDTWVSRDSTHTASASIKIGAVSVGASQENGSSWKMTWKPKKKTKICGNNDVPIHAGQVREK